MTLQQLGITMGEKPAIVLRITVDEQEHTYNKLEICQTMLWHCTGLGLVWLVSMFASSRTWRRAPRDNAFPLLDYQFLVRSLVLDLVHFA
jgi:hypothetical protein